VAAMDPVADARPLSHRAIFTLHSIAAVAVLCVLDHLYRVCEKLGTRRGLCPHLHAPSLARPVVAPSRSFCNGVLQGSSGALKRRLTLEPSLIVE
jgi:hypothetical protein